MVATNAADLPSDPQATAGGSTIVINDTTTSTSYTPSIALNLGTTYYWEVHGRSANYYGTWSNKYSFSTTSPTQNYNISVSASPSAGGSVSGGGTFTAGSSKTVTASANSGYTFSNWTENGSVVSNNASYTFTLNSNRTLVANFIATTSVNLTPYTPTGWSAPIVVSRATGNHTDSTGLTTTDNLYVDWAVLNNGTLATASAFSTELYVDGVLRNTWSTASGLAVNNDAAVFDYSIGSLSQGTHTLRIKTDSTGAIVESNEGDNEYTKTITIGTATQTATLSVVASPSSGGTVSGAGTYAVGSSQQISATANSGWTFTGWNDGNTQNPRTVTVSSGGATYTANFTQSGSSPVLLVTASSINVDSGVGSGTFWVINAGGGTLNWSANSNTNWLTVATTSGATSGGNQTRLDFSFTQNTSTSSRSASITVAATGVSGSPQLVTITQSGASAANYTISVSASPSAGGNVSGGGTFAAGSLKTVTASANSGYTFSNWTENGSTLSASPSYTFTLSGNRNLVANFAQQTGSLQVFISPSGAVSAGAQWQVDEGAWQNSGVTISGLASGTHTIAYKTLSGWTTPASQTVTITANQATSVMGTYSATNTGNVLFSDDFNDNAIDSAKWSTKGYSVVESGGIMQVQTTVTDQQGVLTSQPIAINNSGLLSVTRKVFLHHDDSRSYSGSNHFFHGRTSFYVGSSLSFSVHYEDYDTWTGATNFVPQHGFLIARNGASPNDPQQQADISPVVTPIWDSWFDEKITYAPSSGILEYFINGVSQLTYNVGILTATSNPTLKLEFEGYGWWTGHYQNMDDLVVAQAAGSGSPTKAQMQAPATGSVLSSASATFNWDAGTGVSQYALWVGRELQSYDIYAAVEPGLSKTLALPSDGSPVYINLWSYINGNWQSNSYWYTTYYNPSSTGPVKARLTAPSNGGVLTGGANTLTWDAGRGVSQYALWVGSAPGTYDLYAGAEGTNLSKKLTLPVDGRALYVRLWSMINGVWTFNAYTYTAQDTRAAMLTPVNNTALTAAATTFTWASSSSATQYALWVGSAPDTYDLYAGAEGTNLSKKLTLPVDGRTLYVRLWSMINGTWTFNTYTYTAQDTRAAMLTPVNNAALTTAATTFTWASSSSATQYALWVGSAPGTYDLYAGAEGTNLSKKLTLPIDGRTLYVRLWSMINGTWTFNTYTYTAQDTKAAMLTPVNNAALTTAATTFTWASSSSATQYALWVGSAPDTYDLYAGAEGTNLSKKLTLPVDGRTLYVRLWSMINGVWTFNSYIYKATGP